ncbi:MAG TPA: hypothetical protein VKX45_02050 [Bryobacteraceae bacterium]|jgi:hypothetical protein|nr:hypothetical protein [Bryobacteraceae bacterium]
MKDHDKATDPRLKRLARSIEALAEKDDRTLRQAREIDTLRRHAAAALFAVCAAFVDELNQLLAEPVVTLDPPSFAPESFNEESANLIQVNVRGRVLQVEFHATAELLSTEDFRVPYTLAGSVRAFNQALLDKDLIEEQHIFYTVERREKTWRYFDARTYRSGAFDREYLIALMEQLV